MRLAAGVAGVAVLAAVGTLAQLADDAEDAGGEGESYTVEPRPDDVEDSIVIHDQERGRTYTTSRSQLTRREQVLAIVEEDVRPMGASGPGHAPLLRETGRCRYLLQLPEGRTMALPPGWACLAQPRVKARVRAIGAGRFRYWYVFGNEARAKGVIWSFAIDLPRGDILLDRTDGDGWLLLDLGGVPLYLGRLQEKAGRAVAMWSPKKLGGDRCEYDRDALGAGERVTGLSVTSAYLPALTTARFTDDVMLGTSPNEDLVTAIPVPGVEGASFDVPYELERITIGPVLAPPGDDGEAREAVIARLVADVTQARVAGWIGGPEGNHLRSILEKARGAASSAPVLAAVAGEVADLPELPDGYRGAITLVLGVLRDGAVRSAGQPGTRG